VFGGRPDSARGQAKLHGAPAEKDRVGFPCGKGNGRARCLTGSAAPVRQQRSVTGAASPMEVQSRPKHATIGCRGS